MCVYICKDAYECNLHMWNPHIDMYMHTCCQPGYLKHCVRICIGACVSASGCVCVHCVCGRKLSTCGVLDVCMYAWMDATMYVPYPRRIVHLMCRSGHIYSVCIVLYLHTSIHPYVHTYTHPSIRPYIHHHSSRTWWRRYTRDLSPKSPNMKTKTLP